MVAMSLFVVAPTTAKAAASAGDLIKKDGLSAVYYLGEDGKRYVFPNESTFKSWYSDFSSVVTVSADELASYPLGANVVVRPGTKLVKITTDPKVYAVEPNGTLRWVQTEADAIALYGANWAQRVIDVADSFFTNYTIGTPLGTSEVPVGSLVKKAGENSIYYYDGTNYRLIEDEVAFLANRFQNANVLTLSNFTPSGATITGAEAAIVKTSQSGQATGWKPGQGTGVTVALNSMTPAAQSVPTTVGRIPFTKVNFTASADGATNLESITVKRTGLTGSWTTFKVWAEKDGVAVTSKRALTSNDDAVLTFAPALTIAAGQTATLEILAEVEKVSGNGALGIAAASAVSASGATVSGSFPINGNMMSFTDYDVTQLTFATTTSSYVYKVGDEDVELGQFDVEFTSDERDVVLGSLMLRNTGVEDLSTALMDVVLENNGNVVTDEATFNGRYLTFNFKNGGLTMLKDDGDQTFTIKGSIIGKDSTATDSVVLTLNKKEDLYAYEKATGFGVSYGHGNSEDVSDVEIQSGVLTVSKKSTSPSDTTVIKGSKSVNVLVANIRSDEAITADGLTVYYMDDSDRLGSSTDNSFNNVKVYLNNALLGSFDTVATSSTVYKAELIDSSLSLNKGDNEIKITVDVKSNAIAADNISVKLDGADLLDVPEYVSNGIAVKATDISGTATGATITVEGGDLTVTRNDGYASGRIIVKGSADASLGKFAVKATNDAIKITSISLSTNQTSTTTAIADSSVYDMKLFVDGVQLGTTRNFNAGATFSSLNYTISQNTTKVIELKGSFDSAATGTFETLVTFNGQDSLGKAITAQTDSTTDFKVTELGDLVVELGANTPYSNILVAKAGVEQTVAEYKFTSVDDSSNITEIEITNAAGGADARISAYKLYAGSTLLDTAIPTSDVATFYVNNNLLKVAANASQNVTLKAILNPIEVVGDTGSTLELEITDVVAKSSAGSEIAEDLTAAPTSNEMIILKTKPTFAKVNGYVAGADLEQEMLRFSITADSNEDLNVTDLVFDISGTGLINIGDVSLYEVGNPTVLATTADGAFSSLNIEVSKGTTKTFRVVVDTTGLATDEKLSVSLNNSTTTNIMWGEYFVTGYSTGSDGTYLSSFPISGGVDTY